MSTKASTLVLVAAAACGPDAVNEAAERYANTVCSAIETCSCLQFHESSQACREDLSRRFYERSGEDMEFNADCFRAVIEDGALNDCTAVEEWPAQDWSCIVFQGNKTRGQACEANTLDLAPFRTDECGEGLYCHSGVCTPMGPQPPVSAGDPCVPEPAASCPSDLGIGALYCSDAGVCEYSPTIGESCDSPFSCTSVDNSSTYCNNEGEPGSGTCAVQAIDGESCSPRDWISCDGWCNPSNEVCDSKGPGICLVMHFPGARPTPSE